MEYSSMVAGEILTTLAPAKGEAPVILICSRGGFSGAAISCNGTTDLLPSRRTDSDGHAAERPRAEPIADAARIHDLAGRPRRR